MARLFTGIFPPDDVVSEILTLRESALDLDVRWMPPENLHATLVFIGSVSDDDISVVSDALRSVRFEPFDVAVKGVGAFPKPRAARVLWAGIAPTGSIQSLYVSVNEALATVPPGREETARDYHPHVTVARPKGRRRVDVRSWIERGADFSTRTFRVESFALVRSRTKPQGAEYTVIGRFSRSQ